APYRPGRDLRSCAVDHELPHPRRGGGEGQQHSLRPLRRRVDVEGVADSVDGRPDEGRRGVGEHLQQVRPCLPVRWLQGIGIRARGRPPRAPQLPQGRGPVVSRLDVRKTYKLYIGGEFPRSESGRSYPARDSDGEIVARVAQGSRKDLREAVRHARNAQPAWAARTGYNRGQILYRVAEMIEDRFETFVSQVQISDPDRRRARREVTESIDTLVWYAGWADKFAQIYGNLNPVSGPFFNISAPEPTGVVGVVASDDSALLGLVSRLAAVLVPGNTAVVRASESRPMPAVTLAEVLETSDVPGG